MQQTGLFGKLPAHGDFISRRLPQSFISVWDGWLQCSVAGSQELLPQGWLDFFLTSPIWRFAISSGVIDDSAWAGVVLPSVDSVGRYFPLTLVRPLSRGQDVFDFIISNDAWYQAMETVALSALQEQLSADDVLSHIDQAQTEAGLMQNTDSAAGFLSNGSVVLQGADFGAQFMSLAKTLTDFNGSVGIWASSAGESGTGRTLIRKGLPEPREYAGMITGNFS